MALGTGLAKAIDPPWPPSDWGVQARPIQAAMPGA